MTADGKGLEPRGFFYRRKRRARRPERLRGSGSARCGFFGSSPPTKPIRSSFPHSTYARLPRSRAGRRGLSQNRSLFRGDLSSRVRARAGVATQLTLQMGGSAEPRHDNRGHLRRSRRPHPTSEFQAPGKRGLHFSSSPASLRRRRPARASLRVGVCLTADCSTFEFNPLISED